MPIIDLATGKRIDEKEKPSQTKTANSTPVETTTGKRIINLSTGQIKSLEAPKEQPAEIPAGTPLDTLVQPVNDVVRGATGAVAGGLAGIGAAAYEAATGGADPMKSGADAVQKVQNLINNYGRAPQTQAGQLGSDALQQLGNVVEDSMSYFPKRLIGTVAGTAEALREAGSGNSLDAANKAFQAATSADSGAQALGDTAFNLTGLPAAGAAGQAAYELLAMGTPTKRGQNLARAEQTAISENLAKNENALQLAKEGKVPVVSNQKIADELGAGKATDELVDLVNADKDFFDAADAIGLNTQAPISFATRNAQIRDFAAALESRVGSAAGANKDAFMRELSTRTTEFINKIGESDKSVIDQNLRDGFEQSVNRLIREGDAKYDEIAKGINKGERFAPENTNLFLSSQVEALGGADKLSPQMKKLYAEMSNGKTPTYGYLDHVRKQLGQKIGGADNNFRDEEIGLAKAMYANLTKDLDNFAVQKGPEFAKLVDQAKATTRYRKAVEDNMKVLFGEKLQSSPLTKLYESTNRQLTRGDVTNFNKIMQSVPRNARKDVIAATLSDVMRGGPNKRGEINPTAYVTWYENMQKNAAARDAFFGYMTPEQRKSATAFYKVSKAAQESFSKTTNNGRILDLFKTESKGLGRLFENAATWLPTANQRRADNQMLTPTARAIRWAGRSVGRMIEGETKRDQAAIDLIASPQFVELVRKSTEDNGLVNRRVKDAEQRLMQSRAYQKWWSTLPLAERKTIGGSIMGWMLTEETDKEEKENATVR